MVDRTGNMHVGPHHRTHLDHIGGHSELVYHWPQGQGPEGFYGDSSTKIEVCSDGVLVCGSMLCFVKFLGFESLMMSSMTRVNGSDMQNKDSTWPKSELRLKEGNN
ncbi:hypothetical protein ACJW30_08G173000 [Castanea mollissima]